MEMEIQKKQRPTPQRHIHIQRMDTKRMDWLADRDNKIGNVMLPQECIEAGLLDGLRGMIDEAMNIDQTTMAEHNE